MIARPGYVTRLEWARGLAGELHNYADILEGQIADEAWGRMTSLADELTEFAKEVRHVAKSKKIGG